MNKKLQLSPTTGLNLYKECPRCFWLRYKKGVHRPDAPFPSLPGGIDALLKDYFDEYRSQDKLPPEIEAKVEGKLFSNQELLDEWRNQFKGIKYEDEKLDAVLSGSIDDLLIDGDYLIPLDFKTRRSEPKEGDSEKYYQTQLDCYAFLLGKLGYKVKDYAYLVYYYPTGIPQSRNFKFDVAVVKVATSPDRAHKIFSKAVACLKGPIPKSHTDCGYCAWFSDLLEYD